MAYTYKSAPPMGGDKFKERATMKLFSIVAAVLATLFAAQVVLASSHDSEKQRVTPEDKQASIVYEYIM